AISNGNTLQQASGNFNIQHNALSVNGSFPASGTSSVFTMTATGPMPNDVDLAQVQLYTDTGTVCQVFYQPWSGTFYYGTVQNGACAIDWTHTTATTNGNTITINFGITFNPAVFSGAVHVAYAASDPAGQVSGAYFGDYTIQ